MWADVLLAAFLALVIVWVLAVIRDNDDDIGGPWGMA
jgi:hypothetical protein